MSEAEEKLLKRICISCPNGWTKSIIDRFLLNELSLTKKELLKASYGLMRKDLIYYSRFSEHRAVYKLK